MKHCGGPHGFLSPKIPFRSKWSMPDSTRRLFYGFIEAMTPLIPVLETAAMKGAPLHWLI